MSNNPFGNLGALGGLVKGFSSLVPQDDPNMQLFNASGTVEELKGRQESLYAAIGRAAVEKYGLEDFPEQAAKLRLVQSDLAAEEKKLADMKAEKEAREKAEQERKNACTCFSCGHENPEGTKFCQACGQKLGASAKSFCTGCGAELAPGTRFCGECGARQEG